MADGRKLGGLRLLRELGRRGRWVYLGVLVGAVAGVGAIAFYWLLDLATDVSGMLSGFLPPTPMGEGNAPGRVPEHPLLVPLVTGLGGLASGLIIHYLAPEAEGHGTDEAIEAFHRHAGRIRGRVVPLKTLASAITIGTGGSGGREGPTAQISAGFGSVLGGMLKLDVRERRLLVAAGIGSGIGAIFRAPLGGAVLAAEILYVDDLEFEALYPSLIASIVGYSIFGSWAGWQPIFGEHVSPGLDDPRQLVYYALLGLACGVVGVLYAWTFYGTTDWFHRSRVPRWLKPALGGVLVGFVGLGVPGSLGTGYGELQRLMGEGALLAPVWLLLALPFAKILATSLSIGSGGSGGIFGPGMVIGGSLGVALWRLGKDTLPAMPQSPAAFAVVGMMALFGSVAHAPVAVMIMVAEMTGNLSLLGPAMLAIGMASLVVGRRSVYRSQVWTRADSPAHRLQYSFPLLSTLTAGEAAKRPTLVRPDATLAEVERRLAAEGVSGAPVTVPKRRLVGVITLTDIRRLTAAERAARTVADVMTRDALTCEPATTLEAALELLANRRVSWMPVVTGPEATVTGVVSASAIVDAYRRAMGTSVRQLRGVAGETVLSERRVGVGSAWAGRALGSLGLPATVLVVAIHREGAAVVPRRDLVLQVGDTITLAVPSSAVDEVKDFLAGPTEPVADQG